MSGDEDQAKAELKTGTDLTRRGSFQEAISHLQEAQRAGIDPYASGVNLAICYQGLRRYKDAIHDLESLRSSGFHAAVIDNLLTQAYLGIGQRDKAWSAFQRAVNQSPKDESLYAFIADACSDRHDHDMGLRVIDLGLQNLPDSARLHYERALALAQLDRLDIARSEFDLAAKLSPRSYIASLALVQKDLYDDKFADAIQLLHQAVRAGQRDYQTLSLLGTVLLHQGASPGTPELAEAQSALEESARQRPDYSATQIALGKIYITEERFNDAIVHLELARRLEPDNSAIYLNLAHSYRKVGNTQMADFMQAQLARILSENQQTSGSHKP